MGLRTASSVAVRGPYAEADEVMAPALTETAAAQSQTFKLPPVSAAAAVIDDKEHRLEEPSSPKNGCSYVEKNGKSLFVRNNSTYNNRTPSSALQPLATHNHNNNNTTSCSDIVDDRNNSSLINGDDHSLKQNIDAVPPRTNKSLIIVRRSSSETTDQTLANNSHRTQDSQSIMSDSPTHMGDQQTDEKMGLEKTTGMESVSKINNNSDKSSSEIDEQLLNNLTSIQSNDVDLPQNVDDLMQVFKSIDENDRLINPPNDLLSLPAIEKFLRDDVDVMNMSMEEQQELEARNLKETQSAELIAELKKRQAKVERRLDFLRRKIHKLQARHMGQHVSGEIAGVFEYVHRSLRRLKETSVPDSSSTLLPQLPPSATDDLTSTTTTTTSEPLKPMSYSSTKSLLKKLEVTAVMQANTTARQKPLNRYFGAGSSEPSNYKCTTNNVPGIVNIPPWPLEHKHELQKVSGLLRTELSVVQHEVDSEATESSSGGESCDEMQTYNNPHQQYLGIQKRALWKYATARAAIAARWTWLQAQIADLEYRIRQHTDIHRQIRAAKGEVILGEAVAAAATSGGASPSVAGGTTTTTTPNITTVNGYRGQLPGNSPASLKSSNEVENGVSTQNCNNNNNNSTSNSQQNDEDDHQHHHDNNCQSSARTRPLVGFKKRRLVTLNGLHAISKKAARPSTLRCGCATREAESCAVCTGRTDPAYPRDPPDALSKAERIALVDPGFHPVFSMSEDVSCGIHCDSIMKMTDWQQRSVRMKSMKVVKGERTSEKALIEQRAKNMEHRKKYGRVLKPSTASALSAKIKNKIRGRKVSRHYSSAYRLNRKRSSSSKLPSTSAGPGGGSIPYHHHQQSSTGAVSESGPDEEMEAIENNSHHHHHVSGSGSHHHQSHSAMASPSSSPLLHMQAISGYTSKKNRIDSYDIDNIVIPYSVAASTRVEKLQYKEILTPKWRIAEPDPKCDTKNNGAVKNPSQDSDTEDVTDEAVQMRHDRCEHDEKKKFLSYLKLPFGSYASTSSHHHHHHHHHHRVRSHKQRTDSMAESSGANTPDPMSPHAAADGATVSAAAAGQDNNGISPMTSPPATPSGSNVVDDLIGPLPSVSAMLRRRTISQSRYSRDRESNFNIYNSNREDNNSPENVEIPPYETRTFPLDGDSYDKMLKSMPEDYHQFKTNARAQDSVVNNTNSSNANLTTNASNLSGAGASSLQNNDTSFRDDLSSYLDDKMDSPTGTESTESALGDEDPNDPEWMDVESKDYHRHGHHHHHKR